MILKTNTKKELYFWGLFTLLNGLYFLPRFILDNADSSFFPFISFIEAEGGIYQHLKPIFIRDNYDVFRLSYDFFLLVSIYFFIRKRVPINLYIIFIFLFYLITLLFQWYTSFFLHLYNTEPLLYNDWEAIKLGFMIVFQGLNLQFFLSVSLIIVFLIGLYYAVRKLIKLQEQTVIGVLTKSVFFVVILLFLFNLKYRFSQTANHTFQSQSQLLINNIQGSKVAARNMSLITLEKLIKSNDYSGFKDVSPPNIIFVAIESYGKVLVDHPDLNSKYLKKLEESNKLLVDNQWESVSCFSESPIKGGISWVGYSTMFYGFNIQNHATYLSLLERSNLSDYNSLFNLLQKNNYTNFKLSSIPQVGKIKIPWDKYTRFYNVDHWIKHEDLKYNGNLFGFGPSPPDQYSLNFAYSEIKKSYQKEPFSLFYITQNSHNPFIVPDSLASNWRNLNTNSRAAITNVNFLGKPKIEDYSSSIDYQLDMLTDLILRNGDSNDVFILVGDHQPPFIARENDGKEVPLHIISKNEDFLNGFTKYGLEKSLFVNEHSNTIKHEGFYSMFIREVIRSFSKDSSSVNLPNYLPNGVQFE